MHGEKFQVVFGLANEMATIFKGAAPATYRDLREKSELARWLDEVAADEKIEWRKPPLVDEKLAVLHFEKKP